MAYLQGSQDTSIMYSELEERRDQENEGQRGDSYAWSDEYAEQLCKKSKNSIQNLFEHGEQLENNWHPLFLFLCLFFLQKNLA